MPPGVLAEHDANDLLLHSVDQKTLSSSKGIKKRHRPSRLEDDVSKVLSGNSNGSPSPPMCRHYHEEGHLVATTRELAVTSSAASEKIESNRPQITVTGIASL